MDSEKIKEIADNMEQYAEHINTNAKAFTVSLLEITIELCKESNATLTEMLDDKLYDEAKDAIRIFKAINKAVNASKSISYISKNDGFEEMMKLVDDLEKSLKEENNND